MRLNEMDKDQLMDLLILERQKNRSFSPEHVTFMIDSMIGNLLQDLDTITDIMNGHITQLELFKAHILGDIEI